MDQVLQAKKGRHPPQFTIPLNMPSIPRAFVNHSNAKLILCDTVEGFGFEEQQAIYFYCFLNEPISNIAEKVGLTQAHVASVLGLYSARLTGKLDLFKKALPYDEDDLLHVSELLLG